jgi:hypothetical protein
LSLDNTILEEYEWALKQVRLYHGEIKKWIVYAGQQLEIGGFPKDKISTKLRSDLPEFSADYISQICKCMEWTDKRFSTAVEQTQPTDSSNPDHERSQGNMRVHENQPYVDHLQKKIEFLQDIQRKLRDRPFLSLIDKRRYDEYLYLADNAERVARRAWDDRQTIPVETQFFLAQIVAVSTIKHGASEYVAKVKEISGLTSKQVTKTLKGIVRDIHYLYEPTNRTEALMDGFYGRPCQKCGSWRVRWENGFCRCYHCDGEYRAMAERLPLAREAVEWSN